MNEEAPLSTLAAFPYMSRIFGEIVEARLAASTPDGFILDMLGAGHRLLEWWEDRACKYLTIIENPEDAIRSFNAELLGHARSSNRQDFDGRIKDAIAEVC